MSLKNIGFKVEEDFFKKIKIKIANEGITLKDYIIALILKDLENDEKK